MKRWLAGAAALAASVSIGASAQTATAATATASAPAGQIVIKMATVAPADTPWERLLKNVKKRIQDESGGRVKVQLFIGGVKGGEEAIVRQCAQGSLQMIGVTTAAAAQIVKELDILELPYLYSSYEEADRMLEAATPIVRDILAKKGFVFAMWSENGWRGMASSKGAVIQPADLKGMKMRSQESSVHLATWKSFGAEPVPISVTEVLTALQTGVVDGFDNTPLYAFAASWYQGVKHFTLTDHIFQPAIVVYNKKWFDAQPKDIQAVLLAKSAETQADGRKMIRKLNPLLLENFQQAGIELHTLSDTQKAAFARASHGVWDKTKAGTSADGKKLFDALMKAKNAK